MVVAATGLAYPRRRVSRRGSRGRRERQAQVGLARACAVARSKPRSVGERDPRARSAQRAWLSRLAALEEGPGSLWSGSDERRGDDRAEVGEQLERSLLVS